jgi:hypothetical protein
MSKEERKLHLVRNEPEQVEDDDQYDEEDEYDDMTLLDRLETLREDMETLGLTTLAEVIGRIDELNRKLDEY